MTSDSRVQLSGAIDFEPVTCLPISLGGCSLGDGHTVRVCEATVSGWRLQFQATDFGAGHTGGYSLVSYSPGDYSLGGPDYSLGREISEQVTHLSVSCEAGLRGCSPGGYILLTCQWRGCNLGGYTLGLPMFKPVTHLPVLENMEDPQRSC